MEITSGVYTLMFILFNPALLSIAPAKAVRAMTVFASAAIPLLATAHVKVVMLILQVPIQELS